MTLSFRRNLRFRSVHFSAQKINEITETSRILYMWNSINLIGIHMLFSLNKYISWIKMKRMVEN